MDHHIISTNALDQLQAGLNQITESLRRLPHPGWAQMDRLSQQRSVTQAIYHVLVNIFTQNPKLAPLTQLGLTDQLLFRKALGVYAQLLARAALNTAHANPDNTKDQANKDIFNKKIITAHKFFAAIIIIIYQLQDAQAYREDQLKDLRIQLAALAEKEKSQTPEYTQTDSDKPLVVMPIPRLIPENDEDLLELLEILDLKIGATHKEIEAAFLQLTKTFTPEQNPIEHAAIKYAFDVLMLVDPDRLANLARISPKEINFLVKYLQPQFKHILSKDISLREAREIYLKYTPKDLSPDSPVMRKLHLTMQKLEHKFGHEPNKKFNLGKEFLETPELSRLGQTPRLTPSPHRAIKG
jgi:hypothetical protein